MPLNKTLVRLVALLLVPALIADPSAVAAFASNSPSILRSPSALQAAFTQQALMSRANPFLHFITGKMKPQIQEIQEISNAKAVEAADETNELIEAINSLRQNFEQVGHKIKSVSSEGNLIRFKSVQILDHRAKAVMDPMKPPAAAPDSRRNLPEWETVERVGVAFRSFSHSNDTVLDIFEFYGDHLNKFFLSRYFDIYEYPNAEHLIHALKVVRNEFWSQPNQRDYTNRLTEYKLASQSGQLTFERAKEAIQRIRQWIKNLDQLQVSLNELHTTAPTEYEEKEQSSVIQLFEEVFDSIRNAKEIWQSRLDIATGSRPQSVQFINEIIERTVTREIAHRDIVIAQVQNDLKGAVSVRGNRLSLTSALSNLMDNAEHFSPGRVRLRASQEAAWVRLDIRDEGPGISADLLEFNPATRRQRFFDLNVSQRLGGSGLGTTEAWYAIHDAGGQIEVTSELGHGTVVAILLPIEPAAANASTSAPAAPALEKQGPGAASEKKSDLLKRASFKVCTWLSFGHTMNLGGAIYLKLSGDRVKKLVDSEFHLWYGRKMDQILAAQLLRFRQKSLVAQKHLPELKYVSGYLLARYVDGIEASEAIRFLTAEESYSVGQQALELYQSMHAYGIRYFDLTFSNCKIVSSQGQPVLVFFDLGEEGLEVVGETRTAAFGISRLLTQLRLRYPLRMIHEFEKLSTSFSIDTSESSDRNPLAIEDAPAAAPKDKGPGLRSFVTFLIGSILSLHLSHTPPHSSTLRAAA